MGMVKPKSLVDAPVGRRERITGIELGSIDAAWLAAVGLHEGEELVVLRRGIFGGPIHVRTASGGEFAVSRDIASVVAVEPVVGGEP